MGNNGINKSCKEAGAAIFRFGEAFDRHQCSDLKARFSVLDPLCRELAAALAEATGLTV
jgi:hypothetical protein